MPSCGAPNCRERNEVDSKRSFHILPPENPQDPKRKGLREKWLAQIKRQNIPKYLYICSDHFERSCFEKDLKVRTTLIFITLCYDLFDSNC